MNTESTARASPSGHTGGLLASVLEATRVAVIGASATPGKMGYQVVSQLIAHDYHGEVALINPKGGRWRHLPLESEAAIAGADVAVIAIPASRVEAAVETAARHGVRCCVVLSAGFAEAGAEQLSSSLLETSRRLGVRLLGPNCLGFYSSTNSLNLTTLPHIRPGTVAMVSQSGGVVAQVSRRLRQLGDGFDAIITVGNRLDIGIAESVRELSARPSAGTLFVYLESFDEGDALLDAVRHYRERGPVVALMGGQSAASRAAAASHTASMFGQWHRIRALLTEAGAYVTRSIERAAAASCLASAGMTGPRVFTVCDGGGHSVLLADGLHEQDLVTPAPGEALRKDLGEILGSRKPDSITNPLDLAGAADDDLEKYARVARAVVTADEYDAVLLGGSLGGFRELFGAVAGQQEIAAAEDIAALWASTGLPLVVQSSYATSDSEVLHQLRAGQVPVVEWPSEAAVWLAAQLDPTRTPEEKTATTRSPPRVDRRLSEATELIRETAIRLGAVDGIGPTVDRAALSRLATEGSWVLRLDGVAHKTRVGAIRVGIDARDVVDAYDSLATLAVSLGVPPVVRLAPFIRCEQEILLTVWNSALDGRGIAIGGGGGSVEASADVALGRVPWSADGVARLLSRTRAGAAMIADVGAERVAEFASFAHRFAHAVMSELTMFSEVELNPIGYGPDGIAVLDALPAWSTTAGSRLVRID